MIRVSRYEIRGEIGRGGQGAVYLANDPTLGRNVALKLIHPRPGTTAEQEASMLRSAAVTTARIEDPGVCPVLDVGCDAGFAFATMPVIDGESLATWIRDRRATNTPPGRDEVKDVAAWIEGAARTLHHCHERGCVHGDVKPSNLMVARDGRIVVLDFGPSADHGQQSMPGTPAYLPPERAADTTSIPDAQGDVFALGVSLFETLTLSRPAEGATVTRLLHAIVHEEAPRAGHLNRAVPRDLEAIVSKAIEKDRIRRYRTCAELADELARFREGHPVVARRPTLLLRVTRLCQRRPWEAIATILLISVLGWALVASVSRTRQLSVIGTKTADATKSAGLATDAAMASLRDWRELADLDEVRDLEQRARDLWPPHPASVPRMRAWLDDAQRLLSRFERQADALESLRREALPWDRAAAQQDRVTHPGWRRFEELRSSRDAIAAQIGGGTFRFRRQLDSDLIALDESLARLGSEIEVRRSWSFADSARGWRHESLSALVNEMRALREALVPEVNRRIATAESIGSRTLTGAQTSWARALDSIADRGECPLYHGLRIRPQAGLVPIARNPTTGLWEFAHQLSGTTPSVGEAGSLVLDEESAVVLVLIPGGTFTMGSARGTTPVPSEAELPSHEVRLDPFFISRNEMTRVQWRRCGGAPRWNPAGLPADDQDDVLPAANVDWNETSSVLRSVGLTTPTEAQWECAARAGTKTGWWTGDDKAALRLVANLRDRMRTTVPPFEEWNDGFADLAPVGSFKPSPFGLYDVHGNAWEWCTDAYDDYWMPVHAGDGARITLSSAERCYRGGSATNIANDARSAKRFGDPPVTRYLFLGVRPARRVDAE